MMENMNTSRLCIFLLLVNTFTLSAAIGFAVYKDKATRLVEEGIVSPHRNGSADPARGSFGSTIPRLDRLIGRLGDFLVKVFEEKVFQIADLCKDNDTRTEVLQKLRNDNATYDCVLEVISEGVPLQYRDFDVDSTNLVKALCLHPRKSEDCYEAGIGPIVRQCLSDGATQAHESLMFLWEKSGNAICRELFDNTRQALQNAVIASCFRSKGVQLSNCLGAFVGGNKHLPHLTIGNAKETAPHRCRNMVDLMRCFVGVLERCNDAPLSQFAATVFYKTFEYTTCNITEFVADVPVLPDFLASEYMRSLPESSPINIIEEVLNFVGPLENSEEEDGITLTVGGLNTAARQPTETVLDDLEQVTDFKSIYPFKDAVLENATIPAKRNLNSTEKYQNSTEKYQNSTEKYYNSTELNSSSTETNSSSTEPNSSSTARNSSFTGSNSSSTGRNSSSTGRNSSSTGSNSSSTGRNSSSTVRNSSFTGRNYSSTGRNSSPSERNSSVLLGIVNRENQTNSYNFSLNDPVKGETVYYQLL